MDSHTKTLHTLYFSPRVTDVQYVTCRAQMCTEANRNYPFPEYIDISSLVVQDDYIFIQVRRSLILWSAEQENKLHQVCVEY